MENHIDDIALVHNQRRARERSRVWQAVGKAPDGCGAAVGQRDAAFAGPQLTGAFAGCVFQAGKGWQHIGHRHGQRLACGGRGSVERTRQASSRQHGQNNSQEQGVFLGV